jgi:hypothetical protein
LVLAQVRISKLECALEFYAEKTHWGRTMTLGSVKTDKLQIEEGYGWDVAETALLGKTEAA